MIIPPRAWPCEYCGETHGPGVVCVPRMAAIAALTLGLDCTLVCQYVVEPEPELRGFQLTSIAIDENVPQGTYFGIDRSQFPQFQPTPPPEGGGALTFDMLYAFRDDVMKQEPRQPVLVLGGLRGGKSSAAAIRDDAMRAQGRKVAEPP